MDPQNSSITQTLRLVKTHGAGDIPDDFLWCAHALGIVLLLVGLVLFIIGGYKKHLQKDLQ